MKKTTLRSRNFSALAAAGLLALAGWGVRTIAQTKPQRPQIDVSTINGREVYASSQVGNDTATEVNSAIQSFPDAKVIIITSDMTGDSCDFSGINLTSTQVFLRDERQGKIAWGFFDSATRQIVCQLQADGSAININTLNVTNFNNGGTGVNGLTSGGQVFWTGSGLNYIITAASYNIGGQQYQSPQTAVTLAAADPTNPRIDTFFVSSSGTAGVITGTPAASPSQPSVDPTTQISIGFAQVNATATTPNGAADTLIYDENIGPPAEWTCSTSGSGWNCNDTTHPYQGIKDIQSLGTDATSFVKLTDTAASDRSSNNILGFEVRSETAWKNGWEVWVTFYNANTPVGNTVFLSGGNFGFNGQTTGSYQLAAIPLTSFNIGANPVDNVRFRWNKNGSQATNATIYIDNIILENNGVGGGGTGTSGLSEVIGTGDGNFFPTTIPSTIVGGVETMNFTPNNAPVNTAWLGPLGATNTNVGVTGVKNCPFSQAGRVASYTCAQTSESFAVGDKILLIWGRQFTTSSTTFSDTLGTSFTTSAYTGGSGAGQLYAFGTVTTAGKDTISVANIDEFFEIGATDYFNFQIVHLTGAASVSSAQSIRTPGAVSSLSRSIVPGASTDALIRLAFIADTGGPSTSVSFSPSGTPTNSFNSTTVAQASGASDIVGPGSTSSVSNVATFAPGSSGTGVGYMLIVDVAQSSTAGSGPGHYGQITPNYLTAAAKAAVLSVTEFHMASSPINLPSATSTTVITGVVTMPSSGCPCRALVQGGIFWTASPNGSTADGWWFSDGTNTFGWQVRVPTDSTTAAASSSAMSPVSYSNNQAVTFSFIFNPGTYAATTIQAVDNISPPLPAAAHSWMKVSVLPSVN